jgi:hypothetical protein
MNSSYDPLDLVNTYGAFGSVGRERDEIIFEGTDDALITAIQNGRNMSSKPNRAIPTGDRRSLRHPTADRLANLVRCDGFTRRLSVDAAFCLETSA